MAYRLMLTKSERDAFDWIGARYRTGFETAQALQECMPEDDEWDSEEDIEFDVPEHISWQIKEYAEDEDNLWPCFDDDLREKMTKFVNMIA